MWSTGESSDAEKISPRFFILACLLLCLCRSISDQSRKLFWIQPVHSCSRAVGKGDILAHTTHLTAGLLVLLVTVGLRVQETRVVSRRQLYSLDTAACYCNTGYLGWRWSLVRLSFSLSNTVQALTFLKDAKIYKKWTTQTSTRRPHWIIYKKVAYI